MKKSGIIGWILLAFMLVSAVSSKSILAALFFILAGVMACPIIGEKIKLVKKVWCPAMVLLFLLGCSFIPESERIEFSQDTSVETILQDASDSAIREIPETIPETLPEAANVPEILSALPPESESGTKPASASDTSEALPALPAESKTEVLPAPGGFPESEITGGRESNAVRYILNTNSKKFHYPDCSSAKKIADKNYAESDTARDELLQQGYAPCGRCKP